MADSDASELMSDIIHVMKQDNDDLLKTEAKDIPLLANMKHNKQDLEILLKHAIVEIEFEPITEITESFDIFDEYHRTKHTTRTVICTANGAVFNLIQASKDKPSNKITGLFKKQLSEKKMHLVKVYDLIDMHIKTIPILNWKITRFVLLFPDNYLTIAQVIRNLIQHK